MATLHSQAFGEGPPIVALHGISGHGGRFRHFAAEQLPGFAVHAPDLRGNGRSTMSPPWTLAQHVDDVLATMDELGLPHADVLGFSFGGLVALHVALQAPERVRKLVLLDPAIGLPPAIADAGARNAMTDISFTTIDEAHVARAAAWPKASAERVTEEVEEHLMLGEDSRYRWRVHAPAVVAAYSQMAEPMVLPPQQIPTLLVIATQSKVVEPALAEAYRGAAHIEVAEVDSAHQLLIESPEETGALVRRALE